MEISKEELGFQTAEGLAESADLSRMLVDPQHPFDIDWQQSAAELSGSERLQRLARVKAILPPDNAVMEGVTHDITLENHIRLALDAAGDRGTLDVFLGCVGTALRDEELEGLELLAQQVYWIWSPTAEIAGFSEHKQTLEELALKVLLPEEYEKIVRDYESIGLSDETGLLASVEEDIALLIAEKGLPEGYGYELQARTKNMYSVWRKKQRKDRAKTEIFDLLGLRIIVDGPDDAVAIGQCRLIAGAIAEYFDPEEELEDYIAQPKATGYRSLHQTFRHPEGQSFELQVRTRVMHEQAESDKMMSHQAYDATHKIVPGKVKRNFRKIPKQYTWRDDATLSIRENEGRTDAILGNNLLFFRPDGNLHLLERGATMLDASFRIHSRRALKTSSVLRDGKLADLSTEVRHGELIEVHYRGSYPTDTGRLDQWREIAATRSTESYIKKHRRRLLSGSLREAGRTAIARLVAEAGAVIDDPLSMLDETDRQDLADRAGFPDFDKMLQVIGAGEQSGKPGRIANLIIKKSGLVIENVTDEAIAEEEPWIPLADRDVIKGIIIPHTNGAPICRVAGCCSGKIIHASTVFARASRSKGVMQLHGAGCSNISDLKNAYVCGWREDGAPIKT